MFSIQVISSIAALLFSIAYGQRIPYVSDLEPVSYLGQWFQTHASAAVFATFESNSTCNTANYGLYANGDLSVLNTQNGIEPGSDWEEISGSASFQYNSSIGILAVDFPSQGPEGADAAYWIMEVGPLNDEGLYSYSLVSEPTRIALFILARDVDEFYEFYLDDVSASLESWGFNTTLNPIIESTHTEECLYPEPIEIIIPEDLETY